MEDAVTILVAEDEKIIRELLGMTFEERGYKVIMAESGEEAVSLLDKCKGLRGVITDVRLGSKRELTGWDVARHAREMIPDIAVVFLSGDSSVDWSAQGVPKSVMISKPFAMSQVSTALAHLLNETG